MSGSLRKCFAKIARQIALSASRECSGGTEQRLPRADMTRGFDRLEVDEADGSGEVREELEAEESSGVSGLDVSGL